jgi:hypothetical protein
MTSSHHFSDVTDGRFLPSFHLAMISDSFEGGVWSAATSIKESEFHRTLV